MDNKIEKYIDSTYTSILTDNIYSFDVKNNEKYIKKVNSFFKENLDELFVHSTFILKDDKFIHRVDELDLYEKKLVLIGVFDNTKEFRDMLLLPLINNYLQNNNIKSIEILPSLDNNNLHTMRIFAYNDNVFSIENINKSLVDYINSNMNSKKEVEFKSNGYAKTICLSSIVLGFVFVVGVIMALFMLR